MTNWYFLLLLRFQVWLMIIHRNAMNQRASLPDQPLLLARGFPGYSDPGLRAARAWLYQCGLCGYRRAA
jgi:hypothetical protein